MWDVIEHLPDMVKALKIVSERTLPGGVIIIKTVSRRSIVDFLARAVYISSLHRIVGPLRRMYVPGHLFYFTPSTLNKVLSKFGEVLFIDYTDTPPDAPISSGFMKTGLRSMFLIQMN